MLLLCSFLKSDFTLYKGDWVSVGSIPFFSLYDSDSFLTSSLLFAIRWSTMIIIGLRRMIGRFWVAQAFKERPEGATST